MMRASKAASAERVGSVSVPALVVMGSKDPDFPNPAGEAAWVAEAVHGRHVLIDGAGHYPHAEMPETTAPLIVDFLQMMTAGPLNHAA
jgi:pimeloyl-ACP methyl ester carboxylesterase